MNNGTGLPTYFELDKDVTMTAFSLINNVKNIWKNLNFYKFWKYTQLFIGRNNQLSLNSNFESVHYLEINEIKYMMPASHYEA